MRSVTLILVVVAAVLAWRLAPAIETALLGAPEPRTVSPRGDLSTAEAATVALFETARRSVVFITTSGSVLDPRGRGTLEQPRGSGSGFLWDNLGHVVTNAHVIEGASRATVRLPDGDARTARLVGLDRGNDLAVLRIDPPRAPALPLGSSGDLRVGQSVFAIGNPFGLDFTLTTGVVSALDREIGGGGAGPVIGGLIQTDAAINPGNSGGPLLDSAGRLIGVNTAIFSPSGASAGIGFAVPADSVARVVPILIERGSYAPPVIGVRLDPRLDEMARREGTPGVAILSVEPGGPAAEAGLKGARQARTGGILLGDVITALDGRRIEGLGDLRAALTRYAPGQTVRLGIVREGRAREVEVTLAG